MGLVLCLLVEGKGEGTTAGSHTLLCIEMTRGCVKTSDADIFLLSFSLWSTDEVKRIIQQLCPTTCSQISGFLVFKLLRTLLGIP